MSTRPTGYPDWASQTSTGIVEPIDAKKRVGFKTGEEPAAQYLNWLHEKESSWLRYLSYDWVVNDDFTVGPDKQNNTNATAYSDLLARGWGGTQPSGQITTLTWSQGTAEKAAGYVTVGSVQVAALNAVVSVEKFIGGVPTSYDFIFEGIIRPNVPGNMTGALQVGAFRAGVLPQGPAYFSTSGASGPKWFFNWQPTGLAPTFANLGITYSPSAYQRLAYERRGSTMLIEIDGASLTAIEAAGVGFSGASVGFRQYESVNAGSTGFGAVFVDKIAFGVRRT